MNRDSEERAPWDDSRFSIPEAHDSSPITISTRRAIVCSLTQKLLQPWADHAGKIGLRDIVLTDHDRYHGGVDLDQIDRFRAANPDLKSAPGSSG